MKKLIILLMMVCSVYSQCLQLESNLNRIRTSYNIGDTISIEHQLKEFDVCYGDYDDGTLRLSDFNYNLNGGFHKVIMVRINATW